MNFFKRVGALIYMLILLAIGALFLLVANGVISGQQLEISSDILCDIQACRIALMIIGAILVIDGILTPYKLNRSIKTNRIVAFHNPDGEVTVSLSAIEEYVRKIAVDIPGIKDVRSAISVDKNGINISSNVVVIAGTNIPAITERIQSEVKNRIYGMLGVEEKVNMKIHIRRIARGTGAEEAAPEETPSIVYPPFREM
ncbi:MAG: alkaline shock response membrane anchor protein AmaP [Candidatus Omnitrophica bacterium]|nr:alkaline shock response membrane anchor protein AmaP [Candidatus Omnitrophota bacterium]